ncbi:MAG: MBL fold metallo-hydrolase, partial [bacterium]
MSTSKKIKVKFFTNISLELASILLEVNGKRILVDPGRNERNVGVNQILPFYELQNLDAIVITHYHGDHANLIDEILESGKFRGRIICHKATAEIIQTYYNVEESLAQIIKLDYRKSYDLLDNNMLTLYDAGHVLGSSVVYLKFKDKVIVITGDLGADFLPIVREPTTVFPRDVRIDLLIVDAKQAIRPRQVDSRITPLGDVIYR